MTAQLDLLSRKPRPALEVRTHIAIADTIRVAKAPGWIVFHVPNGEYRELKTAALLKRMLTLPGVSDFICIGPPAGRAHALELKRKGERPSNLQAAFLDDVRLSGGIAEWCNNYNDAIEILKRWGVLRDAIHVSA
jgi:hypothetical protein